MPWLALSVSGSSDNLEFLALVYRETKHWVWYLASWAIRSPALSLSSIVPCPLVWEDTFGQVRRGQMLKHRAEVHLLVCHRKNTGLLKRWDVPSFVGWTLWRQPQYFLHVVSFSSLLYDVVCCMLYLRLQESCHLALLFWRVFSIRSPSFGWVSKSFVGKHRIFSNPKMSLSCFHRLLGALLLCWASEDLGAVFLPLNIFYLISVQTLCPRRSRFMGIHHFIEFVHCQYLKLDLKPWRSHFC